jgi:nucleotidyltransferase substrate binding protein (TIGR01987 family)
MNKDLKQSGFLDKLYNLNKAMLKLQEIVTTIEEHDQSEFFRDVLIKRYEIVWDLIWKTLKEYMEEQGYIFMPSPRETIKKAYQENIINNEEVWLLILKERNELNHTYNEDLSIDVANKIFNIYYSEFETLLQTLNNYKKTLYDEQN